MRKVTDRNRMGGRRKGVEGKYGFPQAHFNLSGKTLCGRHATLHPPLLVNIEGEVTCKFCVVKLKLNAKD